jgi:C4-dicarboxylate-specific signal transduction histidine kinase
MPGLYYKQGKEIKEKDEGISGEISAKVAHELNNPLVAFSI